MKLEIDGNTIYEMIPNDLKVAYGGESSTPRFRDILPTTLSNGKSLTHNFPIGFGQYFSSNWKIYAKKEDTSAQS